MSKFKKKRGKTSPAISTASLPDIIFMLLFFFMVVTVMRDAELKVQVVVPDATELTKLERKSLVHHIYIGKPTQKFVPIYGTKPTIQLNDKIVREDRIKNDIPLFIEQHKLKVPENQHGRITTSFRVDGKVTMGIVQDVKTQLRKSGQLRVNYSARARARDLK
jgi:biopolymer transport protein ExbD